MLANQLIERERVQRVLEVQLLASAACQSKDTDKAHQRYLAHAFPEIAMRQALREARTKRIAESMDDIEFSFGFDGKGNLQLRQREAGS